MFNFFRNLFRQPDKILSSIGKSDVGLVRDNNEDNFGIIKRCNIFIVADGMGGHNAGEVASSVAVETIEELFTPELIDSIRGNSHEIRHSMITCFQSANEKVMKMAVEDESLRGMGCTLVMAFIEGNTLHTCHVGDARCYIASPDGLQQITTDHTSLVELQKEYGDDKDLIDQLPTRNVVTRVIGYPFPEPPEYNFFELNENNRVLLCSDGLWSMVDDQMIYNTLISAESPEDGVDQLIRFAKDAGGNDNITGVIAFT